MDAVLNARKESLYHLDYYMPEPMRVERFAIYQVGRRYCTPGSSIVEHIQRDYIELTVATRGEGISYTNGVGTPIARGDIHLSFPGDMHSISSGADEPLHYDFLAVKCEDAALAEKLEKIYVNYHSPDTRVIKNSRIAELLSLIIGEMEGDSLCSDTLLSSYLAQIIVYIIREYESAQKRPAVMGGDRVLFCYRVMSYIDSHIYTLRSLTELSEEFRYSYNYLSNLFAFVTGETLAAYYRRRRLQVARLLLLERGTTVGGVGQALGYSSVYTFSRAFKEYFGYSPSEVGKDKKE